MRAFKQGEHMDHLRRMESEDNDQSLPPASFE